MSFLQPWMLWGLPLMAIPIVIHLLNQWRFTTMPWAAMMFLLAAQRMTRGYSRLRQWLILALRTVAVGALIVAVSRPLLGGWMGRLAGQRADWTLLLMDRSPSMQQAPSVGGMTKLEAAKKQFIDIASRFSSNHWGVLDSVSLKTTEIDRPEQLLSLATASPASSTAPIPAMMEQALTFLRDQQAGASEIWICSDRSEADWSSSGGAWDALRQSFADLSPRVRVHLLSYPTSAAGNASIRVTRVVRRAKGESTELLVSARLARTEASEGTKRIPVTFEIDGARSVVPVECHEYVTDLVDHPIPIDSRTVRGWGMASIPADTNNADNASPFVFEELPPAKTLLVTEDERTMRPAWLAAQIDAGDGSRPLVEVVRPDQVTGANAEGVALVIWHAPLGTPNAAGLLEAVVERGGVALFFPPARPDRESRFGIRYGEWETFSTPRRSTGWRSDTDLLGNTAAGLPLPVGEIEVFRACQLEGEATPLAAVEGEAKFLVRAPTPKGGAYFWGTSLGSGDSTLARNGVVFFAALQRALAAGRNSLGQTEKFVAGEQGSESTEEVQSLRSPVGILSTEFPHHEGVYQVGENRLRAVTRSLAEDEPKVLASEKVADLFRGWSFDEVTGSADGGASVVQETWRIFLIAMMIVLLAEAILSLPKPPRRASS